MLALMLVLWAKCISHERVMSYVSVFVLSKTEVTEHPAAHCLSEGNTCGLRNVFTVLMGVAVFRAMVRRPLALGPLYTLVREQPVTLAQLRQVPQPHQVLHHPMAYQPLNRSAAPACVIPAHQHGCPTCIRASLEGSTLSSLYCYPRVGLYSLGHAVAVDASLVSSLG